MRDKREIVDEKDLQRIVNRLRKNGCDDALYEVKKCATNLSSDIWESISAFANTEGGTLLLGLDEDSGFVPVPHFEVDKVCSQLISGMGDGGDDGKLTNPPHYSILRIPLEESPVLVTRIEELEPFYKPCYISDRGKAGGSYKRVDDADIKLTPNEVYSLENACNASQFDRAPVEEASVVDLDEAIYVQAFAKAAQLNPRALRGAEDIKTKLSRLNFTDSEGSVTKAGLLVAGAYPQQFFPKLCIDVAVHPGTQKASQDGVRFLDRVFCEGTLGEMIDDALGAIVKNLRRISVVEGRGRRDELEIPEEVLREAIANAVIHRDYSEHFDGEAISVDIYDDRVEVRNPGCLWGGKSRKNLADGRSCCRNATLMKLMTIVPLPSGAGSPAEGNGTGILLMMRMMEEHGLEQPIFCPQFDHFKVILNRPQVSASEKPSLRKAPVDILKLLTQEGELSTRELADRSGLSIVQVRARLRKLIGEGAVEPTAAETSRNRKYRVRG